MNRLICRLSILLCVAWALAIVCLSLVPSPPKISNPLLGWDKFQHAASYGLLTFLSLNACTALNLERKGIILRVFSAVVVFGALMEVAQGVLTKNRSADPLDALANLTGAFLVSMIMYMIRQRSLENHSAMRILATSLLVGILIVPQRVQAGENVFTSATEIRRSFERIGDESAELVKTPVDLKDGGLLGTLVVAGSVALTSIYDEDIRGKLAEKKGRKLDRATDAGSLVGDPYIHLGIAAAIYGGGVLSESPKYRELGEMFGEAAILADAATLLLKESIGRGRPSAGRGSGSFRPFQFRTDYDSIPSMHTASSFAMASVLSATSESRIVTIGAYAAAAFVGFSRIYQDKHWASDVLLGAAMGELCGRIVTGYHASGRSRMSVVPQLTDSSALLALVGRF